MRCRYNPSSDDFNDIDYKNAVAVDAGDDVVAQYAWLVNSARDGAMGALAEGNERTLILGPGKHTISASIGMESHTNLIGLEGAAIYLADSVDDHLIDNANASDSNITVSGLVLNGNAANNTTAADIIHFTSVDNLTIVDCQLSDSAGNGVRLDSCTDFTVSRCQCFDCGTSYAAGMAIGAVTCNDGIVADCIIENGEYGIYLNDTYNIGISGCQIRGTDDDGFAITATNNTITNITAANPAVVTYSGTDNWSNGDTIYLVGIVGNIGNVLNGKICTVANLNAGANTFELSGVNTTGRTYTSGGTVCGPSYNINITNCSSTGSTTDKGIHIDFADNIKVSNCSFDNNTLNGVSVTNKSINVILEGCSAQGNTDDGFLIGAKNVALLACVAANGGADGFRFDETGTRLIGCVSRGNYDYGIYASSVGGNATISGCQIVGNGWGGTVDGIWVNANDVVIIGCTVADNRIRGIEVADGKSNVVIQGNAITGHASGDGIQIGVTATGASRCLVVNNTLSDNAPDIDISLAKLCTVMNNNVEDAYCESKFVTLKNTSGGQLVAGDVVVIDTTLANDNEFTTTTAQGDDMVLGMVAETIADNGEGLVQTLGKTTALKVDGTTDIAVGDFIGTFTAAGIGQKAAAGDMAIAIALEAYTTDDSAGVIDAILITPRKV